MAVRKAASTEQKMAARKEPKWAASLGRSKAVRLGQRKAGHLVVLTGHRLAVRWALLTAESLGQRSVVSTEHKMAARMDGHLAAHWAVSKAELWAHQWVVRSVQRLVVAKGVN